MSSLVGGRYAVGPPLGRGGMSNVHEAWDEVASRRVALKQLRFPTPTARRRYQREARLLARLRHPGVAEIYEVGDDHIAMEYVQGRPLQEVIAELAPLPTVWVAALGTQIAAVLACAHRVNLVHRDIKPSNILLTPAGAVRVVDFGMSTLVGDETLSTLTPPGVSVGSERYMSPECRSGLANPRSDLFSLGVVLRDLGAATDYGLTAVSPDDRPPSALAVISLLEPLLGPLPPLHAFVGSPDDVLALVASYVDQASVVTALPPRPARAEAERLVAAGQAANAIALLDASIAALPPDHPLLLDLRRDLLRILVTTGDADRGAFEAEILLPLLRERLGPDHPAVIEALTWQATVITGLETKEGPPP